MNQKSLKTLFIIVDILTAGIAWALFFYYRKTFIEHVPFEVSDRFYIGLVVVPLFWFCIYFVLGTYNNLRRMYLMRILSISMRSFFIGTLGIFFFLILDDEILIHTDYYKLLLALFIIHSFLALTPRLLITNYIVKQIARSEEHTSELQSRPHLVC